MKLRHWVPGQPRFDNDTGKPYRCYELNGIDFWYHDKDVVTSIYLIHHKPFPPPWQELGLDWGKSYDEWLSLLRELGYSIKIKAAPSTIEHSGHDSFSADVIATKETPIALEIELDFSYSRGTATGSPGTLYSMKVTSG